ncbi:MAG TPA: HEAT repeat domain-containing protein [Pirellulales bacterium]|nr:HEAT repeat domain-containing protein [Pirellulales bacterium]
MSKSKSASEKRADLNALRDRLKTPESAQALRKGLADRSNRVVGKAAEIVAETDDKGFEDDLKAAYARLLSDPVKSDPGCLGKTAIVEALVKLECRDLDFYRAAVQYRQYEGVWGGDEDTAAQLRAAAAIGLVLCSSLLEALNRFAEMLTDRSKIARAGAARAIAALAHPEGVPLLRLKLLLGDKEPEVVGECCAAMLQLAPDDGLPLVVQQLASPNPDVALQVALALGESRHRQALEPLRSAWRSQPDADTRAALLIPIALLRTAEANEFLLSLLRGRDARAAADALRALKIHGKSGDLRRQIEEVVRKTGNSQLVTAFEREFGPAER